MSTLRTDEDKGGYTAAEEYSATQDALARCRQYRKHHGLYGVVDAALGRIVLEIGSVGAVVMPSTLGERVRGMLVTRGLRCGPIIAHPRSGRWTFLTGPIDNSYLDTELFAELFRVCASVALPGSDVVLPSPADERSGYRTWMQAPDGDFRPDFAQIVAATRTNAKSATLTRQPGSA
ncbi:hypothetical protein ACWZHB_28270 [Nocardia sp. FBN12]|uniref:hypothetical protein n=1 Tax=Nocardia sp. FBN12 TaxID=3419766 RepID=UPI003D03800D